MCNASQLRTATDNSPFFIVGVGRSGTTLLRLMLSGHSRLHVPPETWYLRDLVKKFPLHEPLTPSQVDEAVNIVTQEYRWPDMEIASEDFRSWAKALVEPRLVDIANLVYRHHLERAGKQRFGEKTPNYIDLVPELAELYPGARFIHLIRDGRDVAISWIDAGWHPRYYERHNFPWSRAVAIRQRYRDTPYDRSILDVRYEDLVAEPEATIRRICDFLGETFEPAMLQYQQRLDLVPAREQPIHGKLSEPIRPDAIAVWRRKLRLPECFAMEACLRADLLQSGYALRFSSTVARPFLVITAGVFYAMAPLLKRGVPYLQRRRLLPRTLYI